MRGGLVTPKIPARVIHTSIRVPVTAEEYAAIKRAAKLRGAPSLAAWLRERGASHAFADGIEGLATAEDCKDALRRLLETREAYDLAPAPAGFSDWPAFYRARDAYWAAHVGESPAEMASERNPPLAKEVAK